MHMTLGDGRIHRCGAVTPHISPIGDEIGLLVKQPSIEHAVRDLYDRNTTYQSYKALLEPRSSLPMGIFSELSLMIICLYNTSSAYVLTKM